MEPAEVLDEAKRRWNVTPHDQIPGYVPSESNRNKHFANNKKGFARYQREGFASESMDGTSRMQPRQKEIGWTWTQAKAEGQKSGSQKWVNKYTLFRREQYFLVKTLYPGLGANATLRVGNRR